ncbi:MAG: Flp family type IVb pilin, partial [Armatimonadia bacterium]
MLTYLRSVWQDEEGVTTVEYALILALVSVVAIAAWQGLGIEVREQATNTT